VLIDEYGAPSWHSRRGGRGKESHSTGDGRNGQHPTNDSTNNHDEISFVCHASDADRAAALGSERCEHVFSRR
jgi:hypothetical protein